MASQRQKQSERKYSAIKLVYKILNIFLKRVLFSLFFEYVNYYYNYYFFPNKYLFFVCFDFFFIYLFKY